MKTSLAVPYVDLALTHQQIKAELAEAVNRIIDSGCYILGPEVEAFERDFAAYCQVDYAVGVDNGTNALCLALRALGIGAGDEVITAPNSFLATASSIALVGARPVFVDVRDDLNIDPDRIESAITPRTRAIIPVHLTGRPADMEPIMALAQARGLYVIEDAAQAVGAEYQGRRVGSFGQLACFSVHPLKNLAALGDGGMITTNDAQLCQWLRKARNHGLRNRDECEFWSPNARLDELQAAILRVKLRYLDEWTAARRANAAYYQEHLGTMVDVPRAQPEERSVYHTFVIQTDQRDALVPYLTQRGIEMKVHYPIPIHLQPAAREYGYQSGDFPVAERQAKRVLSLPVFAELTSDEREVTRLAIEAFFGSPGHSQV